MKRREGKRRTKVDASRLTRGQSRTPRSGIEMGLSRPAAAPIRSQTLAFALAMPRSKREARLEAEAALAASTSIDSTARDDEVEESGDDAPAPVKATGFDALQALDDPEPSDDEEPAATIQAVHSKARRHCCRTLTDCSVQEAQEEEEIGGCDDGDRVCRARVQRSGDARGCQGQGEGQACACRGRGPRRDRSGAAGDCGEERRDGR